MGRTRKHKSPDYAAIKTRISQPIRRYFPVHEYVAGRSRRTLPVPDAEWPAPEEISEIGGIFDEMGALGSTGCAVIGAEFATAEWLDVLVVGGHDLRWNEGDEGFAAIFECWRNALAGDATSRDLKRARRIIFALEEAVPDSLHGVQRLLAGFHELNDGLWSSLDGPPGFCFADHALDCCFESLLYETNDTGAVSRYDCDEKSLLADWWALCQARLAIADFTDAQIQFRRAKRRSRPKKLTASS